MPVLARLIEAADITTVLVTMMPFWAERKGTPRTLAVEFPFGQSFGQPHAVAQQTQIVGEALDVLENAAEAGTVVHSEATWPVPQREAYKAWQPSEASPVIELLAPQFREMRRKARGGS